MRKITLLIAFAIATLLPAQQSVMPQMLADLIGGKYKAKPLPERTELPDGQRYAQLCNGCIVAYSYKTGAATDTLFNVRKTKKLTIDTVEGFLLSPSMRHLLVYKNVQKVYRRSFTADWYIYNIERGELSPLSSEMPVMSPVFSPNGRYIAFSRHNNLFVHKLDFSTEVAVTTDGAVGKIINGTPDWLYEEEFTTTCMFSFSPDSKQLAFVRLNESAVSEFRWQEFLEGDYPKDYSLKYPKAGTENSKASVVVYDILYKSLKTIPLEEEDRYIPRIRWTDNEQLAIFCLNRRQNKLDMLIANSRSTLTHPAYSEHNPTGWVDYAAVDEWQLLADDNMVVVSEQDGYRHAWLYTQSGQRQRLLTNGNYDVTSVYGVDEKNGILYFQAAADDPMTRYVYALTLKNGKLQRLTTERGTHRATFSADYSYFVDAFQSATQPTTYTLYTGKGKKVRELLGNSEVLSDFNANHFARKRFLSFPTIYGDTLNAFIILPDALEAQLADREGFDASLILSDHRYPVLQVQYSGPESQQVLDVWKPDWEYFLAKQGVVVVCADPRGTGARGKAWRELTYMHLGELEAQDQVATAKYMASLSFVDPERIGIWGWSYGGYMTLRAMTEPEGVFCCGISVAPVTDWRLYDSGYTERFMQRVEDNDRGYDAASVITRAGRLHGRLLLCHGVADDNVHCQQSWKFVDALVQAGVQFDMQIYPDDNHFLRKRRNYSHLYLRKWEFLKSQFRINN